MIHQFLMMRTSRPQKQRTEYTNPNVLRHIWTIQTDMTLLLLSQYISKVSERFSTPLYQRIDASNYVAAPQKTTDRCITVRTDFCWRSKWSSIEQQLCCYTIQYQASSKRRNKCKVQEPKTGFSNNNQQFSERRNWTKGKTNLTR